MAKILWSADYSVQSKYLDLQHQNLLMILNEFNEAVGQGQGKVVAFSILNKLVQYTEDHFRDEEKLMKIARFPDDEFNAHVKEHERLIQAIFKLCSEWEGKGEEALPQLGLFLKEWLLEHILKVDKKYREYVALVDDDFMFV